MSSGFVTEAEIEAKKKARQEEWERVRKPNDPEIAPEEPIDNRSLFERLEENRIKKQEEWDESHKLKNQIRGIDDDEADFLDTVDAVKMAQEKERISEETKALKEYRESQDKLLEQQEQLKKKHALGTIKFSSTNKASKSKPLLGSVVVKKRPLNSKPETPIEEKRPKTESSDAGGSSNALAGLAGDYSSSESDDE